MDKNFLEFWGQLFLSMSKGQRQFDELSQWMQKGFGGAEGMSTLFRQVYGLEKTKKGGEEYLNLYEKASEAFQQSFREYLHLFELAPREEYENLMKECEALRQKVSEQEQTIGDLRKILSEKGMESVETVQNLQNVLKKQTDQFQEMMKTMGQMFQQRPPSKSKSK